MDLYDDLGMIDEKAWYFVRSVQGVLGFLGGTNKPTPLSDAEVEDLLRPVQLERVLLRGRKWNLKLVKLCASRMVRLRISRERFRRLTTSVAS